MLLNTENDRKLKVQIQCSLSDIVLKFTLTFITVSIKTSRPFNAQNTINTAAMKWSVSPQGLLFICLFFPQVTFTSPVLVSNADNGEFVTKSEY